MGFGYILALCHFTVWAIKLDHNIVYCFNCCCTNCFVVLQPVNANVLLNDTSELEARVEVLEVEVMNVQSDVANIEDDVNNVEIQVNNLETEVTIVESELINVQEDITDNEDQIFGVHVVSLQTTAMFCRT